LRDGKAFRGVATVVFGARHFVPFRDR
jgi:hypothetical protein